MQSLDVPLASQVPSPPLDCDILLPPPAESLYTLPRPSKAAHSSTEQLLSEDEESSMISNMASARSVRFDSGKDPKYRAKRGGSKLSVGAHTESVV